MAAIKKGVFFALVLLCSMLLCALASVEERELQVRFNGWMRENQRSYRSEEFARRYAIWRDNLDFVERHNADETQTYKVGLNEYSDMTQDEFIAQYSFGLLVDPNATAPFVESGSSYETRQSIPSSFDWRNYQAVTAVKNQGACGACWAFSVTATIEGAWKNAGGQLVSLSDQSLLDCSTGNLGCNGGYIDGTLRWVINNNQGWVNTEASYPYTAVQGSCRYNTNNKAAAIKAYESVVRGDESSLLRSAAKGPVSVGINASPRGFQMYKSGVYTDSTCTSSGINHAVTVVGWGNENGQDYWLVKNQWGASWGANGYIKMARNSNNQCGISSMAFRACTTSDCSVPTPAAASPSPLPKASPSSAPKSSPAASPSSAPKPDICYCPCACSSN